MKVSVVMPVYNGAQYLQEAIDSILNQTFKDFELIIIDDGSSDDSLKIIQMNADKDKRIIFITNEQNSGICVTLNKGLDIARGKYIVRMDCDDISELNRIEKQVCFMDEHPEIGVLGSKIRVFGENVNPYIFDFDEDWKLCIADMIFATCMAHPAVIVRSEIIQKHKLRYDDRFRGMEDYYMWWQISKYAKISNIQEALLNYRKHSNQVTRKKNNDKFLNMTTIFLNERLNDLRVSLDEKQKQLLLKYIYGNFQFNDAEIYVFIKICKRILLNLKGSRPELVSSAKLVVGKAISQIVICSKKLSYPEKFYYRKAFVMGCMPFIWFLKSRIHQIIGR